MSEDNNDLSLFGEEDNNPFPHSHGITGLLYENAQDKSKNLSESTSNEREPLTSLPEKLDTLSFHPLSKVDLLSDVDTHSGSDQQDETDSMLLYPAEEERLNKLHHDFGSRVSNLLSPACQPRIEILDASKSNEGNSHSLKTYVVYTIRLISDMGKKEEIQTRRRYSDFESLRDILWRIFPLIIIPPIPPKNYSSLNVLNGLVGTGIPIASTTNGNVVVSPGDSSSTQRLSSMSYSYINSNHLNRNRLIEHRKRLLANFLNRCMKISQIRRSELFAKFLDPSANWSDEVILVDKNLPKSIYQLNPENALQTDSLYSSLPIPTSSNALGIPFLSKSKIAKKTNQILGGTKVSEYVSTEQLKDESSKSQNSNQTKANDNSTPIKPSSLDDINRRIVESLIGMSSDYVELGTALNSFSLNISESSKVKTGKSTDSDGTKISLIFDHVGVAFDRSYSAHRSLIAELETKFSEPLGEVAQYSQIFGAVKKFHDRKQMQKTMLEEEITGKRAELGELRKKCILLNGEEQVFPSDADPTNHTLQSSKPSSSSKLGLFNRLSSIKKITKYVTDIIDQNPEQTRYQRICNLQEKLATLEKCQSLVLGDISYISDELVKSKNLFQTEQLQSIFRILLAYNSIFIEWARKNIEIWEEIKDEIDLITI